VEPTPFTAFKPFELVESLIDEGYEGNRVAKKLNGGFAKRVRAQHCLSKSDHPTRRSVVDAMHRGSPAGGVVRRAGGSGERNLGPGDRVYIEDWRWQTPRLVFG